MLTGLLLSCLSLSGCVEMIVPSANAAYHHRDLQNTASDYYINLQARRELDSDPQLSKADISITCFNRVILLTGQVSSAQLRDKAITLVRNVPNVIRVYNAISIGQPISTTTEWHDSWITTKIKTQFVASNDIDPSKIKIVTEDGIVYLLGVVPRDEADAAVNIARHSAGVKRVVMIFYYITMPKIS